MAQQDRLEIARRHRASWLAAQPFVLGVVGEYGSNLKELDENLATGQHRDPNDPNRRSNADLDFAAELVKAINDVRDARAADNAAQDAAAAAKGKRRGGGFPPPRKK